MTFSSYSPPNGSRSQARPISPPGCTIEVRALMSSVAIIVPPGLNVAFHIDPFLGAAGSDADDGMAPGLSRVRITGSCFMAGVRVHVRGLSR